MTTSRPHARRTPPTHGFTLTEVLLAAALAAGLITLIVNQLTGLARQNTDRATEARATATVNTVIQAINKDFERGTFAAFQTGTRTRYVAVFTTGTPVTLPKQAANLHTLTTIRAPRLNANVGDQLLLIAANGTAKLTTITAQANPDDYTLNCPTGLPSTGRVTAYRAFTSGIDATGTRLKHITPTTEEDLGPNSDVRFDYVYQAADGTLVKTPPGAPANATPAGPLIGFIPGAQQDQTAERRTMIPTTPRTLRRIIACQEMGLTTVNEGRLNVTILGLPDGQAANVTLHGPDPAVNGQHPAASTAYTPVQPGTYTIEAQPITIGKVTYLPEIGGSPATLYNTWGDTFLQVKYVKQTGQLNLTVTGLPPGSTGTVRVRGPEDRDLSLPNGTSNLELPTGAYAVTADKSGSATPTVTPESFTVSTGASQTVAVNYEKGVKPEEPLSGAGLVRISTPYAGGWSAFPSGWLNINTNRPCEPKKIRMGIEHPETSYLTYQNICPTPYGHGNLSATNDLVLSRVDGQPFTAPSRFTFPTIQEYPEGSSGYSDLYGRRLPYVVGPVGQVTRVTLQRGDYTYALNLPAGQYKLEVPEFSSRNHFITSVETGIGLNPVAHGPTSNAETAVPATTLRTFTVRDGQPIDVAVPYAPLYRTATSLEWTTVEYTPPAPLPVRCLVGADGSCLDPSRPEYRTTHCAVDNANETHCSPDGINGMYPPPGVQPYCRVDPRNVLNYAKQVVVETGSDEPFMAFPDIPVGDVLNCLPPSVPSKCFLERPSITSASQIVPSAIRVFCGPEDVSKYGL